MNNKNVSVWRGDNTPPTQYHLWLKNDGKLYVNIDEQWQEIDKDSVAEITEILNQHATKLDNHQTALDDINTLHSKLWIPGRGNYSVITQGVASNRDSANKFRAGNFSLAEGLNTVAEGICSHAEGNGCQAILDGAHAEGITSRAEGFGAHAENNSHAEGRFSHSEGSSRTFGTLTHAEGQFTQANGHFSHSEGNATISNGEASHAEGLNTRANGTAAHAEGFYTKANGAYSHVEGSYTETRIDNAHAQGRYNISSDLYLHSIGIGTETQRKNSEYVYFNPYIESDTKNGYKYLIGIGGYDGINNDVTTYKSLQEVISDVDSTLKVKADLVDGKVPLEQLGNLDMVLFEVVRELPTTNIKKHIYLMKVSELESGAKNLYAEYIYTGDTTATYDASKWEKLGVKQIETDLSDYYTKEETDSQIQAVKNKFPLSISSFTVTPQTIHVGEGTTNVTYKWSYNNEDVHAVVKQTINDKPILANIRTMEMPIDTTTVCNITATLKANDSLTKSIVVHVLNYSYTGLVSADTTTVTDTTGLTNFVYYGKELKFQYSQVNQKIVYLYPAGYGSLTSIADQNGFEGISGFEKQTITINNGKYYLYISKIPATSNVTLTFK